MFSNKVIILGHLTRDIEIKRLNTGMSVGKSAIASNSAYRKQDGSWEEVTCFIDFTMFGQMAERANNRIRKGSKVLIEGRLQHERWQDQQGNNRSKHSIVVENYELLDKREQGEGYSSEGYGGGSYGSNYGGGSYGSNNYGGYNRGNTASGGGYGGANDGKNPNDLPEINVDDEIPF